MRTQVMIALCVTLISLVINSFGQTDSITVNRQNRTDAITSYIDSDGHHDYACRNFLDSLLGEKIVSVKMIKDGFTSKFVLQTNRTTEGVNIKSFVFYSFRDTLIKVTVFYERITDQILPFLFVDFYYDKGLPISCTFDPNMIEYKKFDFKIDIKDDVEAKEYLKVDLGRINCQGLKNYH